MDVFLQGVTKKYGTKLALNVENLQIKSGGIYGIIGSNGVGKTTLLKIVAGVLEKSSGSLLYGSEKNSKIPYAEMTLVFQKPYMLDTSVEQNVAYPLKQRHVQKKEIEQRVLDLLNEFGIYKLRKQKATSLSGGEAQRVSIARALSFRPKLLLLDEPTASIDPATVKDIERIVKKENKSFGTTVIIITHNLQQARRLCSDIVFLDNGMVLEQGSALQVLDEAKSKAFREFVDL